MEKFLFSIDKISAWVGKAFGWLIMVAVLGVSYDVTMTKLFRMSTPWAYDLNYMTYGALFMMSGAYALSRDAHVRGDVIFRLLRPRRQAIIELILYFLFFFPGITALMYAGADYAWQSWTYKETSVMSIARFPIFQLKFVIPIAAFFLFLQGIAQVIRCVICIRNEAWPNRLHDVEELETMLIHQHEYEQEGEVSAAPDAPHGGGGKPE